MIIDLILYISLGCVSGFTAGLFGLGGGVLIVPGLLWIFLRLKFPESIQMHLAEGSSLACMMFTSLSSIYKHNKLNNILWPIVKMMVPYVILGVILGAVFAWWIHGFLLTLIFAIYLIFVAIKMLLGPVNDIKKSNNKDIQNNDVNLDSIKFPNAGGLISGFSAGLLGIGGGTFMVPYLNHQKLNMSKSVATASAFIFPVAFVGTITYIISGYLHSDHPHIIWTTGFIYWPGVIIIGITSMIFAPVGAKCSNILPSKKLKKYFGWFILIICASLLYKLFQSYYQIPR